MNGLMLQREMDNTADYGVQRVESKKGFLEKNFKIGKKSKLANKIPIITRKATHHINDSALDAVPKKTVTWGGMKYLGRLGIPAQIFSIVVLGTLLGATYAVTMQSGDRQRGEGGGSVVDNVPIPQENVLQLEQISTPVAMQIEPELQPQEIQQQETISQQIVPEEVFLEQDVGLAVESETTELKKVDSVESDLLLSLNTSIDKFHKIVESPSSIRPKGSASSAPVAKEVTNPALNKYDRKIIKELKQKIRSVKQKAERYGQRNLRLEGKLELLTVKNRALSNQLRQLDSLSDSLKKRYQIED